LEGVVITNVETTRPERDITKVKCYNCNKKGHYSNECPNKDSGTEKGVKEALAATLTIDEDNANDYDNWEEFSFHQSNCKVNPT
jgi:hypothetical protein